MILIDRIKVLEEMLGIMFQEGQESGYYDDKIEIGAMTYKDVEYEDGKSEGLDIAYNMIADAPEVKAISVEWIEKYAKRFIELENRNYFAYRGFSDIGEAILNMLENWEKENGK